VSGDYVDAFAGRSSKTADAAARGRAQAAKFERQCRVRDEIRENMPGYGERKANSTKTHCGARAARTA